MLKERRTFSIGSTRAELGCSTRRLRLAGRLEATPPARIDYNGRLCSEFDIVLLKIPGLVWAILRRSPQGGPKNEREGRKEYRGGGKEL